MVPVLLALLGSTLTTQTVSANTYVVTNLNDSGAGSLRAALNDAGSNVGKDTVTFKKTLAGSTIEPTTELYVLDGTVLDGDLNNDGTPDIALSGAQETSGNAGLVLNADNCVLDGVALVDFTSPVVAGAMVTYVANCTVRSCYFGVGLDGTTEMPNLYDLLLYGPSGSTIGQPGKGNVFAAQYMGIDIRPGQTNVIQNNRFGTTAGGNTALGTGGMGLSLTGLYGDAGGNIIRNNVFAGLQRGIGAYNAHDSVITGNLFGLGADGTTYLPIDQVGVDFGDLCIGNRIGGGTPADRNVFAGAATAAGASLTGANTRDNKVYGNYFGTNAAGDAQRTLGVGVVVRLSPYGEGAAGPQVIGGAAPATGNYFAPGGTADAIGCDLDAGGSGSTVRNNSFGLLPNGLPAPQLKAGILANGVTGVRIESNTIARSAHGIDLGDGAIASVLANAFRSCDTAVYLSGTGIGRLGNLGNASPDDDGGNLFRSTNTWFIQNRTASLVKAEGNDFGTTLKASIDTKIYDKRDDPALGRVDFIPLIGGVVPAGDLVSGNLAVTGLTALPAANAVQATFSLTAAADVSATVVNIAGRPVRSVVTDRPAEAGRQTLLWDLRSDAGLRVPAGRYLVRIVARSADGQQTSGLAGVSVP